MAQPMEWHGINPDGLEICFQWMPTLGQASGSVPVVTAMEHGRWVWQVIVPIPRFVGLLKTLRSCTAPDCLDQRLASGSLAGDPSLAGLVGCVPA